jgi:glycosyltransferase involved in cell wall biosynthesis
VIRILYLIDVIRGLNGGTERHLHTLVRNLDPQRFTSSIVAFNLTEQVERQLESEGIEFQHLPVTKLWTPRAMGQARALSHLIRSKRVDIVQTFHFKSDTFGVVAARMGRAGHVISSRRDTGDRKSGAQILLHRLLNPRIERFITVCDRVGQAMQTREGVPASRRTTIYNGVDLERFRVPRPERVAELRHRLGFEEDDFVVGQAAYFRPEKNFDVFFKAVAAASRTIPRLKAIAVGRGPTLEPCRQYCREAGIEDRVVFTGLVDDVRDHVAVMDVACLIPGSNEGLSNSVLEKMAMGRPLVVTDVGGNSELVVSGENGIVIPALDVSSLTRAFEELYSDRARRIEMDAPVAVEPKSISRFKR